MPLKVSTRSAELEAELSEARLRIAALEAELSSVKQQLEEAGDASAREKHGGHGHSSTNKKKRKGGKRKGAKKKKGARAEDDAAAEHDGDARAEADTDLISYEQIAQKFPSISLAEVLKAEGTFAEADVDGNGVIDVTELDKWLTKQDLIFSVNQVTALLLEMDLDGDDSIDFLEYLHIVQELKDPHEFQEQHQHLQPNTSAAFAAIRRAFSSSRRASRNSQEVDTGNSDPTKSAACVVQ